MDLELVGVGEREDGEKPGAARVERCRGLGRDRLHVDHVDHIDRFDRFDHVDGFGRGGRARPGRSGRSRRRGRRADRGHGAPAHDLDRDRTIGMPGGDPRRRHRHRVLRALVPVDVLFVGDVQLDQQEVFVVVETGGADARQLAELELEVVERPDRVGVRRPVHRFASFAS